MNTQQTEIFIAGLHYARMQIASNEAESRNQGGSYSNTGVGAGQLRQAATDARERLLRLVRSYDNATLDNPSQ